MAIADAMAFCFVKNNWAGSDRPAQNGETIVIANDATTHMNRGQARYDPPQADPLKEAAVANASLKLHLRRLRRDLASSQEMTIIQDILDASAAIARWLECLRGRPGASDHTEPLSIAAAAAPAAGNLSLFVEEEQP
jgi:hypothetical protein